MRYLSGQVAVVTGGAGGIGSAICETLAAAGASVVVGYNTSARQAQALADRLHFSGQPHTALALPVQDSAALNRAAQTVAQNHGRCDIVVNCAGTTRFVQHSDMDSLDDALIDQILATNVRGPFAVIRAFRSLLAQSGSGLAVNVSSIAAVTANGSNVMYCASKAAVDNMTKSLGRALAPAIRVVSVSPGLVDTEFVQQLDDVWREQQVQRTPLGRLARPQDVAQAVLAAATHLTYATGFVIPVDGGRPLA